MAPVAAEIMPGRPPTTAITTAIQNEAYRPTRGSTPAIIEKAIASGTRARATTRPASKSARTLPNHSVFSAAFIRLLEYLCVISAGKARANGLSTPSLAIRLLASGVREQYPDGICTTARSLPVDDLVCDAGNSKPHWCTLRSSDGDRFPGPADACLSANATRELNSRILAIRFDPSNLPSASCAGRDKP